MPFFSFIFPLGHRAASSVRSSAKDPPAAADLGSPPPTENEGAVAGATINNIHAAAVDDDNRRSRQVHRSVDGRQLELVKMQQIAILSKGGSPSRSVTTEIVSEEDEELEMVASEML